jgi:hypothetical protein
MRDAVVNSDYPSDYNYQRFCKVIDLLHSLNDMNIFRTERNLFVPAYFEGILIGVAMNLDKYENNTTLLKNKINQIKTDEDFKAVSGTGSNSKSRVRKRLQRANEIFVEN